ncbi:MAG TPA: sulfotransferase [Steroidobacteraceae bacterium]|nr:sulfotransferase [Steroidobacteraceae bacterium]
MGTLDVALAHASRLLRSDPNLAAQQAAEILRVAPDHPEAMLLLGVASRMTGQIDLALATLERLVATQPNWAAAHYEWGVTLGEVGRADAAVPALQRAVALKPDLPDAWREIASQLTALGDREGADRAYARHIKASNRSPQLMAAAFALSENQLPQAEHLLREHLKKDPNDVAAIRMFAEVAGRLRRYHDAENLLARCLELAPGFNAARYNYAMALYRLNKPVAALRQIDILMTSEPRNSGYRNLRAVVLANIGSYQESLEIYADVLAKHPDQARIWLSYGHALSTAGRTEEGVAAYRRSIALVPSLGEAYYSLANLKTFRFEESDAHAMRAQLQNPAINDEDRIHFHFAIAKALEDSGSYAESFEHYARGNELRCARVGYDPAATTDLVQRARKLLTREFFAAREGYGAAQPDPIFIVGLPRAGSTLLEQILASHSQVEGTMELPDIMAMASTLGGRAQRSQDSAYPEALAGLSAAQCRALGEQYLEQTRIQRKTGKPFFIDKMPNNFLHIGLIRLALPNARIIDARRHPMACCFSGFKQNFAQGQRYTYRLEDIGRYYRDYVELMAHFDSVLPGSIHRVFYENLIEDTEGEVRRLLGFCGLPFEPATLSFYNNERAVRTVSAQQVRKPIFREGIDHWRHYEQWLAPLRAALGALADAYPEVPRF